MNLVIVTTIWQRPLLTATVLSWYQKLRHSVRDKIHIELLAAGSEGEASKTLAESNGWNYVEAPNAPLSLKWNHAAIAARTFQPDAILFVGSDDIIDDVCLLGATSAMCHASFFGLLDLWFLDLDEHHRLGYWAGYNNYRIGEPHGVARTIRRDLLDELEWCFWPMDDSINRILDRRWYERICGSEALGMHLTRMNQIGAFAVDIKLRNGGNICAWDSFTYQDVLKGDAAIGFLSSKGLPDFFDKRWRRSC